jgi:AcrR family transcriptional regulator
MTTPRARVGASERQRLLIEAATECFAERGFGGTTTARIAAAAGINEALVFRHFGTKQALYLACIDSAWSELNARISELVAGADSDADAWRMPGRAFLELLDAHPRVLQLWMRGLVETTGVEAVDARLAQLMLDGHRVVRDHVSSSQAAGGIDPERDPAAEAWTILALGLLGASLGTRSLVPPEQFAAAVAAHHAWVTHSG